MIWESSFWKEPLLKSAVYLDKVRLNERTSERTLVRIEKEVLVGFYAIRKLVEAFKITDKTKTLSFNLSWYPARRRVDLMNWHRVEKNYFMEQRQSEERDLLFLSNQFIHSYLFLASEDRGRLSGFFVASDRERHKKCYFVERQQVVQAFRSVGSDYPIERRVVRDPPVVNSMLYRVRANHSL